MTLRTSLLETELLLMNPSEKLFGALDTTVLLPEVWQHFVDIAPWIVRSALIDFGQAQYTVGSAVVHQRAVSTPAKEWVVRVVAPMQVHSAVVIGTALLLASGQELKACR